LSAGRAIALALFAWVACTGQPSAVLGFGLSADREAGDVTGDGVVDLIRAGDRAVVHVGPWEGWDDPANFTTLEALARYRRMDGFVGLCDDDGDGVHEVLLTVDRGVWWLPDPIPVGETLAIDTLGRQLLRRGGGVGDPISIDADGDGHGDLIGGESLHLGSWHDGIQVPVGHLPELGSKRGLDCRIVGENDPAGCHTAPASARCTASGS
jgi:hypothetical protein